MSHEKHASDTRTAAATVDAPGSVRRMAVMVKSWSKRDLYVVFAGIFAVALFRTLAGSMEVTAEPFVLSSFGQHDMTAVLPVFSSILGTLTYPIVSKLLDVFGRPEVTVVCILSYVAARLLRGIAGSVWVFASSVFFDTFAGSGMYLVTQILIADSSSLVNRGLLSNIVNLPFLFTVFIGPPIASAFLTLSWRYIYIFSAIIVPISAAPLLWKMFATDARLRKSGEIDETMTWRHAYDGLTLAKTLVRQLDLPGVVLLAIGLILFFLPFLIGNKIGGFSNGGVIAMLVIGLAFLACFMIWEIRHAPTRGYTPIMPIEFLTTRTAIGSMITIFFVFIDYYLYHTFLLSYLRVTRQMPYATAGIIDQLYSLCSSLAAVFTGVLIKYTRRHRIFTYIGIALHITGVGMMIAYRGPDSTDFQYVLSQSIAGVGGGFLVCSVMVGLHASVPREYIASTTTFWLLMSGIGGSVGGAIASGIWNNMLPGQLRALVPNITEDELALILGSIEHILELPVPVKASVIEAYVQVQRYLSIGAIVALVPAVLGVFAISSHSLEETNSEVTESKE
ncbi:hypothetical protein H9P43_000316 [Blastocladiella emersonii ATCC 22665]|nr:hypothetical protein H9P43_000316 [Blastocladiella emersonii ATCC 22665]